MRNRLRFAEKVAGLSALALLAVLLLVDWFAGAGGIEGTYFNRSVTSGNDLGFTAYAPAHDLGLSGWDSLGWLACTLCVLTIVAGLAVPLVFGTQESPVLPLFVAICALFLGTVTVIALLIQVALQPGTDELVSVQAGWWLGLLAAAGVARGGFLSMRDEYLPGVPAPDVPVRPAPAA